MPSITEAASARVAHVFAQLGLPNGIAVRCGHDSNRPVLKQDSERAGDTGYQHAGRRDLLLDARVAELLAEDTLDVAIAGLTLQHTDAASSCQR